MAIEVTVETVVDVPVQVAFDYVNDYRNVASWLYGISKFEPIGELDRGLGATFEGSMSLGVTLHSQVKVTEFEEGKRFVFDSIKGFRNWSTWTFTAIDDTHSTVRAEVAYELPGGLAGKAIGKAIEPFVKIAVKHSSEHLAKNLAGLPA